MERALDFVEAVGIVGAQVAVNLARLLWWVVPVGFAWFLWRHPEAIAPLRQWF